MYLHENEALFQELVTETAQFIKLPEVYVEKDYWVTRALKQLSVSSYAQQVVFKGGTSLSKAYRLIDRFSEDIDLAIFPADLSNNAKKKLLKNIEGVVTSGLIEIVDPRTRKGSSYRRTIHKYPAKDMSGEYGQASPVLHIEVNCFTNPEPFKEKRLQTLIADMLLSINRPGLVEKYGLEDFSIAVLSVERTLVEKIMGVVKDSYHENPVQRLSSRIRHLYDICVILQDVEYRSYLKSPAFQDLCISCVEDERLLFKDTSHVFDKELFEAPLFQRFPEWRPALEVIYQTSFRSLVYREPPHIDAIEKAVKMIGEVFLEAKR